MTPPVNNDGSLNDEFLESDSTDILGESVDEDYNYTSSVLEDEALNLDSAMSLDTYNLEPILEKIKVYASENNLSDNELIRKIHLETLDFDILNEENINESIRIFQIYFDSVIVFGFLEYREDILEYEYQRAMRQFELRNSLGSQVPGIMIAPTIEAINGIVVGFYDRLDAFFEGMITGMAQSQVGNLSEEELRELLLEACNKYMKIRMFGRAFKSIFTIGALYGTGEYIKEELVGLYELYHNFDQIKMFFDEFLSENGVELSYNIGFSVGMDYGDRLVEHLRDDNIIRFVFNTGKFLGPIYFEILMFFVGLAEIKAAFKFMVIWFKLENLVPDKAKIKAILEAKRIIGSDNLLAIQKKIIVARISEEFYELVLPITRYYDDALRVISKYLDNLPEGYFSNFLDDIDTHLTHALIESTQALEEARRKIGEILKFVDVFTPDEMRILDDITRLLPVEYFDDIVEYLYFMSNVSLRKYFLDTIRMCKVLSELLYSLRGVDNFDRILKHTIRIGLNDWQGALGQLYSLHKVFRERWFGDGFGFEFEVPLPNGRRMDTVILLENGKQVFMEIKCYLSRFSISKGIRKEIVYDLILGIPENFENIFWMINKVSDNPEKTAKRLRKLREEFIFQLENSPSVRKKIEELFPDEDVDEVIARLKEQLIQRMDDPDKPLISDYEMDLGDEIPQGQVPAQIEQRSDLSNELDGTLYKPAHKEPQAVSR